MLLFAIIASFFDFLALYAAKRASVIFFFSSDSSSSSSSANKSKSSSLSAFAGLAATDAAGFPFSSSAILASNFLTKLLKSPFSVANLSKRLAIPSTGFPYSIKIIIGSKNFQIRT